MTVKPSRRDSDYRNLLASVRTLRHYLQIPVPKEGHAKHMPGVHEVAEERHQRLSVGGMSCRSRGSSECLPLVAMRAAIPVFFKNTFLLREPWPCDPAAETAIQPQTWCFQSCIDVDISHKPFVNMLRLQRETDLLCSPRNNLVSLLRNRSSHTSAKVSQLLHDPYARVLRIAPCP